MTVERNFPCDLRLNWCLYLMGYIAVESGWIVRCVGRQPWTLYGQIRTADAASILPASNVLTSLTFFAIVYSILLVTTLYFASKIIAKGPNLELPLPELDGQFGLNTAPAELIPDSRPYDFDCPIYADFYHDFRADFSGGGV